MMATEACVFNFWNGRKNRGFSVLEFSGGITAGNDEVQLSTQGWLMLDKLFDGFIQSIIHSFILFCKHQNKMLPLMM